MAFLHPPATTPTGLLKAGSAAGVGTSLLANDQNKRSGSRPLGARDLPCRPWERRAVDGLRPREAASCACWASRAFS
jgi:hypothetical protein